MNNEKPIELRGRLWIYDADFDVYRPYQPATTEPKWLWIWVIAVLTAVALAAEWIAKNGLPI